MLRKQQHGEKQLIAIRECDYISTKIALQKVKWAHKAAHYVQDLTELAEGIDLRANIAHVGEGDEQRLDLNEGRNPIPRPLRVEAYAMVEPQVLPGWARRRQDIHPDLIVHEDQDDQQGRAPYDEEGHFELIDHLFFKDDQNKQEKL